MLRFLFDVYVFRQDVNYKDIFLRIDIPYSLPLLI